MIAYGRDEFLPDDIRTYKIGNKLDIYVHGIKTRLFDTHGFESKKATQKLITAIEQYKPDVIWLHNLHGYYLNIELLFEYLKKIKVKVKWTLHDCWSFTGHCAHFSYVGCDKWLTGCYDCPQKKRYPETYLLGNEKNNYKRKKIAFCGVPDMEIIVVSHWLEALVKRSFLKDYKVTMIYNNVDEKKFKYHKSDILGKYGIAEKKIILGVATDWTEYKGLYDFYYLAEKLSDEYKVVLLGLTQRQIKKIPSNILGLERTKTIQELVDWYSASYLHVVASKEETFGMTLLEARKCGTQVIAYKGTACEEVVNMYGGILVEQGIANIYEAIINMEKTRSHESFIFS